MKTSDRTVTYHDLYCFANGLRNMTGEHAKAIGILTNDRQKAIMLIASAWINGITIVPLSASSTIPELSEQVVRSGIHTLFCDETYLKSTQFSDAILADIDQLSGSFKPLSPVDIDDEQLFGIFFTSGSTGKPKAVPLKRRQMVSAARSASVNNRMNTGELWLHCLPLNHIGGVSVILRSVLFGSGIYLTTNVDTPHLADILSKETDVKAVSLVPTQLTRLADHPGFAPHNGFHFALIGGGRVADAVKSKAGHIMPVIYSYGMTETCAQIVAAPAGMNAPDGSTGRVLPPNTLTIRDESGNHVPNGQTGLICLKGPQVFDGYLDGTMHPFFPGGWFNTGDYGYTDTVGFLFIETRREDRIVTGGENVDPLEVESALLELPGILEAAVIGLPDEEWGHIVTAVVVTDNNNNLSLKSIRAALKSLLSDYKIPRRLEFVDALPKTALGKVKKGDLAAFFSA